jgi:hypothetical protein
MSGKPGAFSVDGAVDVSVDDIRATLRSLSKFGFTKAMIQAALEGERELIEEVFDVRWRWRGSALGAPCDCSLRVDNKAGAKREAESLRAYGRDPKVVRVRRYRVRKAGK